MTKEQLVNKFIRCTSQEMQDRVARRLEELGVEKSQFFIHNACYDFPTVEIFEMQEGKIKFSNFGSVSSTDIEITESHLNLLLL